MHITFLTPEYPHSKVLHSAGIGTSIKNLVVALVKKDIKVSVVVYGQSEDTIIQEDGVEIHLVKKRKYKWATWYFYRKYLQDYLNALIVKNKVDLVEAPDWTGITAFMNLKAPLVIRFHGSDTYFCHLENRKQKRKNFWFEKLAIQKAKAFITPTAFAGKLTQQLFKIRNKKIATIHYGLEVEKFRNDNAIHEEKGLLLYIGTVIRKKGVLELPDIMKRVIAKMPEARLILIGGDSYDAATGTQSTWQLMQELMDDNVKNSIEYLGKVPYQEVRDYIQKAQVCVFPTFAETLGMVTIESMAMKKAVVNSNIGWAQELIIDGESGYLVHPGEHETFSAKISDLLEDDQLRQRIGLKAEERVCTVFNIDTIVEQNIAFYQKTIAK